MEEYVKTYSSMKAKSAAAIFDTMTDDLGLVADILNNMDTQSRADILAAMDSENAAKITQILEPSN
jgi:flagellar motility protein MotE (MotC chaperone)